MRAALLALCVTTVAAGACGGGDGPPEEILAQLDVLARAPNRLVGLSTALVAPGTLLVSQPEDSLLISIEMRLGTETNGCAKRTLVPGSLSVQFQPDSGTGGCTLATSGVVVTGSMNVTIVKEGATVRVLVMMDLVIDGETVKDQLVLVTSDGNQFSYRSLATVSGVPVTIPTFTGMPLDGTTVFTASGTTAGEGMAQRTVAYTGVTQRFASCHPRAGSLQLTSASEAITRTLTYSDQTPQTDVAVYVGGEGEAAQEVTLPHLDSCPPLPAS